ncbi:MAG TPA: DNA polymerase Y family protein [Flavitalea sp.]|nr:DNA polymerase Y family protein [Flavitalea sp.]
MEKRYVSVWFPYLKTEWFLRRHKDLRDQPLVLYIRDRGRMLVSAVNKEAYEEGIVTGMLIADAKAVTTQLHAYEEPGENFAEILFHIGEWFIRFSPGIALDLPDGIIIDASGCTQLWGGDQPYLQDISSRMRSIGYTVKLCMAGTIGAASAMCRYGISNSIVNGTEEEALAELPPAALRIDASVAEKLNKLGLRQISALIHIPANSLRRRMGALLSQRLQQALGNEEEAIQSIIPQSAFNERCISLEPIITRTGIEIALQQLLETICERLTGEQKGARVIRFTIVTIDSHQQQLEITTTRASSNARYLFKLFELKLSALQPGFGIDVFIIDVLVFDELLPAQESLWINSEGLQDVSIAEFVDRLANKIGHQKIARYLPARHYWPERSIEKASSLTAEPFIEWSQGKTRPVILLSHPEKIIVSAPIPDYPPMNFRHNNKLHKVIKADGPERIEQEWWIKDGVHRDYYYVEDEEGNRYWIFRSGHYETERPVQWYLHGYCA